MKLGATYDRNNLPAAEDFTPVPAGKYIARIEKCEVKDAKSGKGQYLNIMWKLSGPTHAGRVVFDMINFRHQNPTAQDIGLRQLSGLISAAGIARLDDSDQLIGATCEIKVSIREQDGRDPENQVKSYSSLAGSSLPKPLAPAEAATAAPEEKKAPWLR